MEHSDTDAERVGEGDVGGGGGSGDSGGVSSCSTANSSLHFEDAPSRLTNDGRSEAGGASGHAAGGGAGGGGHATHLAPQASTGQSSSSSSSLCAAAVSVGGGVRRIASRDSSAHDDGTSDVDDGVVAPVRRRDSGLGATTTNSTTTLSQLDDMSFEPVEIVRSHDGGGGNGGSETAASPATRSVGASEFEGFALPPNNLLATNLTASSALTLTEAAGVADGGGGGDDDVSPEPSPRGIDEAAAAAAAAAAEGEEEEEGSPPRLPLLTAAAASAVSAAVSEATPRGGGDEGSGGGVVDSPPQASAAAPEPEPAPVAVAAPPQAAVPAGSKRRAQQQPQFSGPPTTGAASSGAGARIVSPVLQAGHAPSHRVDFAQHEQRQAVAVERRVREGRALQEKGRRRKAGAAGGKGAGVGAVRMDGMGVWASPRRSSLPTSAPRESRVVSCAAPETVLRLEEAEAAAAVGGSTAAPASASAAAAARGMREQLARSREMARQSKEVKEARLRDLMELNDAPPQVSPIRSPGGGRGGGSGGGGGGIVAASPSPRRALRGEEAQSPREKIINKLWVQWQQEKLGKPAPKKKSKQAPSRSQSHSPSRQQAAAAAEERRAKTVLTREEASAARARTLSAPAPVVRALNDILHKGGVTGGYADRQQQRQQHAVRFFGGSAGKQRRISAAAAEAAAGLHGPPDVEVMESALTAIQKLLSAEEAQPPPSTRRSLSAAAPAPAGAAAAAAALQQQQQPPLPPGVCVGHRLHSEGARLRAARKQRCEEEEELKLAKELAAFDYRPWISKPARKMTRGKWAMERDAARMRERKRALLDRYGDKELDGCTFQPELNPYSTWLASPVAAGGGADEPFRRIYEMGMDQLRQRRAGVEQLRHALEEEERPTAHGAHKIVLGAEETDEWLRRLTGPRMGTEMFLRQQEEEAAEAAAQKRRRRQRRQQRSASAAAAAAEQQQHQHQLQQLQAPQHEEGGDRLYQQGRDMLERRASATADENRVAQQTAEVGQYLGARSKLLASKQRRSSVQHLFAMFDREGTGETTVRRIEAELLRASDIRDDSLPTDMAQLVQVTRQDVLPMLLEQGGPASRVSYAEFAKALTDSLRRSGLHHRPTAAHENASSAPRRTSSHSPARSRRTEASRAEAAALAAMPAHERLFAEATIREQRAREAYVHQQIRDVMERGEPLVLRPDFHKPERRTSSQPHQRPPSPAAAAKGHGHQVRSPAPVAVPVPAPEPQPKPSPLSPHQLKQQQKQQLQQQLLQKQQQRPRGSATRRTSSAAAAPPQAAPRNAYTNSLFGSAGPPAAASAEKPSSAPRDPQTPPSRASPEALEEYAAQLMRHQLEHQKEEVLRCLFQPQPATPPPQPARGRSESVHSKPEWRAY